MSGLKVVTSEIAPRFVDTQGLMNYTSLRRTAALQLGELSGSKVKFGRRSLYEIAKIDAYLDSHRDGDR